jgi:class 3 adenylate cyclase
MKCPKCQHENPENAVFCNRCGQELMTSSESSSQALSFDEKLNKIQRYLPKGLTEKILAQKDKIEGERKQVTVMFCDMKGFTPLVEKLGAEEAYNVMDQVYEILIHKVHDYEGTVNEMTGDGIMALFGAPIALEDASQWALRSALSIHREMTIFNEQHKLKMPIQMRVGIHTGPVVVGTLGNDLRVEFKAVGDTVNLASRMEGLAEPGSTYVTGDVFKLTEELFHFECLGNKAVKGKEGTVPVYKLLSARKDVYRPRLGSERMIYSKMVGRNVELDKLELQVLKAINGEGSVVNIIGEAGIGKSRLIAELKKREVMERVTLLEGRSISIGKNLSFHPIIDLFKQWARIAEDDSEIAAFNKLESAVGAVHPEEADEILPFVATLMGMKPKGRHAERVKDIEGEALEKLIAQKIRELLIKASDLRPTVVLMEDLHWADTSSIELLESIYRLAEKCRLLFINVFRPGYFNDKDGKIANIAQRFPGHYVQIDIRPLEKADCETLIDSILNIRGLPHFVRNSIVDRGSGNPFFIEEVLRSLIDDGAIVLKEGHFEVTEKIHSVVIPPTINDVLMARIDHLDERTRELVKVASVIGRSFFDRIIKDIAGSIEDVDIRLSYLKNVQLIRDRRRMHELEYLFKHALAQEAAYESILLQNRKRLHLKVASSIEKIFKERVHEFYGALAYHFSMGEDEEKAEEYLVKAGEEALQSSASSEALYYYGEALKLYLRKYGEAADPQKLASFEKNIAVAFFNKGQLASSLEYFDKVFDRWHAGPPRSKIAAAAMIIGNLLTVVVTIYFSSLMPKSVPGERDIEIAELWYKMSGVLADVDPKRMFGHTCWVAARICHFGTDKFEAGPRILAGLSGTLSYGGILFKLARKILEHSRSLVDVNNPRELIALYLHQSIYDHVTGRWEEISRFFDEKAIDNAVRAGMFWDAAMYTWFCGIVFCERGKFLRVEELVKKLDNLVGSFDYPLADMLLSELRINLFIKLRKIPEALIEVERGNSLVRQYGMDLFQIRVLGYKATLQILLNDTDGAKSSILEGRALAEKIGIVPPLIISTLLISEFLFNIHMLEEAVASGERSLMKEYRKRGFESGKAVFRNSLKYAPYRPWILRLMGVYYWLIGRQRKALERWGKSIQEAERLGARPDLSRTYFEMGKRMLGADSKYRELNGIKAESYLEKARLLFEEMGLKRDLDELDRISA